jgi:hypothetical protein
MVIYYKLLAFWTVLAMVSSRPLAPSCAPLQMMHQMLLTCTMLLTRTMVPGRQLGSALRELRLQLHLFGV